VASAALPFLILAVPFGVPQQFATASVVEQVAPQVDRMVVRAQHEKMPGSRRFEND
jgi:hypothetical protein